MPPIHTVILFSAIAGSPDTSPSPFARMETCSPRNAGRPGKPGLTGIANSLEFSISTAPCEGRMASSVKIEGAAACMVLVIAAFEEPAGVRTTTAIGVPGARLGHWKVIRVEDANRSGVAAPFTSTCTPARDVGSGIEPSACVSTREKPLPTRFIQLPGLQADRVSKLAASRMPEATGVSVEGAATITVEDTVVPQDADTVTICVVVTEFAVAEKVAELVPVRIVTAAGVTSAAELPLRLTMVAAVADFVSETVHAVVSPPRSVPGVQLTVESCAGPAIVTAKATELPFALAEIVAVWSVDTEAAVAAKVLVVAPAAMAMLAGTERLALLLDKATFSPPPGAAPVNVTVQVVEPGAEMLA